MQSFIEHYYLFFKDSNPVKELTPTIAERRSDWYIKFTAFFHDYIPRTPPVKTTHLYDEWLKKMAAARKRGKTERKHLPIIRRSESSIIEISITQDRVITELNKRLFKLETIIQVI